MRFFFDNCVAIQMAQGIAAFAQAQGTEVLHLSERFPASTRDVDWILAIRADGWIIVSGDLRISRNPVERAAWHESRLTAFFLDDRWANKQFWVQAVDLVRWWPIMVRTAKDCTPGSGYRLPFKGDVPRMIYSPEHLR